MRQVKTSEATASSVEVEPFTLSPRCVKCIYEGVTLSFTDGQFVRAEGGRLLNVTTTGDRGEGVLHVHCRACNYEWLMRPADYEENA